MDEGIGRMSPLFDLSAHRIPGHDACYYIPDFLTEKEEEYLIRKVKLSTGCQTAGPGLAQGRLDRRISTAALEAIDEPQALQLWGGELTSKNVLISQAMPPFVNAYPDIIDRLKGTGAFTASPHGKPNHIIIMFLYSLNADELVLQGTNISPAKPHEDGPAYFPVVATISLGSHCIFHYYQYKKDDAPERAEGRSIDSTPVLSVLLEPRSVVISEGALYRAHLHAIREIEEDVVTAGNAPAPPMLTDLGVPVANWDKVTGADTVRVMSEGGALKRATRYSLTCRDVEKVSQLKAFIKR